MDEAACTTGARVGCDDTEDCVALGFTDKVCCAFNDSASPRAKLRNSECVASSSCDANGPQDQLCTLDGSAEQCQVANDGRTKCAPYTYSNASGYSFCQAP